MTTMTASSVLIKEITPDESLRRFIDVAWTINERDPNWIAPLRIAVKNALDRKRHPFHEHAEVAYFLATRAGESVGRIAAIINRRHNEFHDDSTGFFGLFECEDSTNTAEVLLETATNWLRERGCTSVRGPVNLSTNDEISSPGVLVDGFAHRPLLMMAHNPPYYASLLEASGFEKGRDLIAFWFDDPTAGPTRGERTLDRLLERQRATIRPLDMRRFRADVDAIKAVYNSAWTRNWGFVPMTDAEFEHLAKEFRPFVDPDLCLIAEVDGEAIGFSLTLPDLNQALRHVPNGRLFPIGLFRFLWHRRRINSMRVMTVGFTPKYQHAGLGPAFYIRTWQTGVTKGYTRGEGSWVLEENNEMVRPLMRMGGDPYKRYRIYERAID